MSIKSCVQVSLYKRSGEGRAFSAPLPWVLSKAPYLRGADFVGMVPVQFDRTGTFCQSCRALPEKRRRHLQKCQRSNRKEPAPTYKRACALTEKSPGSSIKVLPASPCPQGAWLSGSALGNRAYRDRHRLRIFFTVRAFRIVRLSLTGSCAVLCHQFVFW